MSASGVQWWCSAGSGAWAWRWRPYPGVWLFAGGLAASYAWRWRRAGRGRTERGGGARAAGQEAREGRHRRLAAAGGVLLLWIALDWPLGPLGAGYLEVAHMLQFLLVVMLAPPLLLYGLPPVPAGTRRPSAVRRALTYPGVTLVGSATLVVAGHTPFLVDTLMASQAGSLVLDLAWLAAGLLLWWPLLSPVPEERLAPGPLALVYLWAALLADKGVGIWLLMSPWPLYRTYELAPPVHGISANTDQGVAGAVMLLAGMGVLLTAIVLVVRRWMEAEKVEAAEYLSAAVPHPGAAEVAHRGS